MRDGDRSLSRYLPQAARALVMGEGASQPGPAAARPLHRAATGLGEDAEKLWARAPGYRQVGA